MPATRAEKIGVISNANSTRNKKGLGDINRVVSNQPDVIHTMLEDFADLAAILDDFAAREVGVVAINGGDGTVQATLTELLNRRPFERQPAVAIVARGMTNLIAHDVGLPGRADKALIRLFANGPSERLSRPVVSLENTVESDAPIHGMFFGAGAYYHGIMLGRERVHPAGFQGSTAAGLAIGLALISALTGRGGGLLRGEAIEIALDGEPQPGDSYLLTLATTLNSLILGVNPFWGGGTGGLRHTSIAYPPARLASAILPVLRGRARPWMADAGYHSGRADEIALTLESPVIFDGQTFTPRRGTPLVLKTGPVVEFLRC